MGFHDRTWRTDAVDWTAPVALALTQTTLSFMSFNWIGDAGANGNGDWNTPGDWQQDGIPGTSDSATFATGNSGYTVTGDATIGAITVDGDGVTFDGAITQFSGATGAFLTGLDDAAVTIDPNSFFTSESGSIAFGAGSLLDVQGSLLTGGGNADVVIDEGLSGNIVTAGAIILNQLYVQTGASFAGSVILNDNGSITLDTSSTFGGGSITLTGSGSIYEALAAGEVTGTADISDSILFTTPGTLTVASDPGAVLTLTGQIAGAGSLLINNGTIELAGTNAYTGSTIVQNATLIADGQGAVPDGVILLSNSGLTTQPDTTGAVNFTDTVAAFGATDTVYALGGNLLVYASQTGLFTFLGGAGSDTIIGGAGALSITGGSAGDLVFGNTGTLTFTGGAGGSTVVGGAGVVDATGGAGGDVIFSGTSGHDVLNTGDGPTTLVGGQGAQLFATGSGNSVLIDGGGGFLNAAASTGNDTLFGGAAGSDTIISGAATNIIVLNGGATTLYTTGTADVFAGAGALSLQYVDGIAGGLTNVVGFDLSTDQINLVGYAQGTAQQVLDSETVSGGNTMLQIPQGDQVVLFGVTGLTLSNFA